MRSLKTLSWGHIACTYQQLIYFVVFLYSFPYSRWAVLVDCGLERTARSGGGRRGTCRTDRDCSHRYTEAEYWVNSCIATCGFTGFPFTDFNWIQCIFLHVDNLQFRFWYCLLFNASYRGTHQMFLMICVFVVVQWIDKIYHQERVVQLRSVVAKWEPLSKTQKK